MVAVLEVDVAGDDLSVFFDRVVDRLEEIFAAPDEQTVTVPGTEAAALIVPSLAGSLTAVLDLRKLLARRIEELLEVRPLPKTLTSVPGSVSGPGPAF
ncbi:hypothetical protein SAMN05216481_11767 [Streptomyces radiopugnans]|uniref:Uncharacterized protein n=1 Tax=Streptomyces radiopugnans TaxID=403935 RepID=A0A1H9JEL6_9ACTN|nr:hypothetical protein SAMN05216481_11767 [Streptomyces radiopugnans]